MRGQKSRASLTETRTEGESADQGRTWSTKRGQWLRGEEGASLGRRQGTRLPQDICRGVPAGRPSLTSVAMMYAKPRGLERLWCGREPRSQVGAGEPCRASEGGGDLQAAGLGGHILRQNGGGRAPGRRSSAGQEGLSLWGAAVLEGSLGFRFLIEINQPNPPPLAEVSACELP